MHLGDLGSSHTRFQNSPARGAGAQAGELHAGPTGGVPGLEDAPRSPGCGPAPGSAHHAGQAAGQLRQTTGPEAALGPLRPGWPSRGASAAAEVAQTVVGMPFHLGGHRYIQRRRSPALRPHTYLPAIRDSVCGSGIYTPRARYDATSGDRGSLGPESSPGVLRAACERDSSKGRKNLVGGTAWRAGGRLVAWAGFRQPDSRSLVALRSDAEGLLAAPPG